MSPKKSLEDRVRELENTVAKLEKELKVVNNIAVQAARDVRLPPRF